MEQLIAKGANFVGTALVGESIKAIVKEYISPILKKNYDKSCEEKDRNLIEYKINEYLEKSYNKNLYMNTIIFKNQQKKIDDLYVPLTVIKCSENIKNKCEKILINGYSEKFIPSYNKVLLVDNAGMGKSTIIKYLHLSVIRQKEGIPILIELRNLKKNISIIDFIINEINGISGNCNKNIILELIEGGDFIFFLDGYDEIATEDKKELTQNIQKFIGEAYKNKFIISSRDESGLSTFGDFQRFDIKPLSKKEAYELIKKYDNNGEVSEVLIEKLKNEENFKILKEFLSNPLMTSLLYKSFDYKRNIPYKKHIFYRQVYEALYEDHDLSKGGYNHEKKCDLNIDDLNRILRSIAFVSLNKGINYSKEEFLKIIKLAKSKNSDLVFKDGDLIHDLIHSVPLFIKEGGSYRWIHKSFQEYFVASYIWLDSKEKQKELLDKLVYERNISKYYNILDFFYDMDYKQFCRNVLLDFFKEYEKFYENTYNDDKFKSYDYNSIKTRKELEFTLGITSIYKFKKNTYLNAMKAFNDIFEQLDEYGVITGVLDNEVAINFGKSKNIELIRLLENKGYNGIILCNSPIYTGDFKKVKNILREHIYKINDDINNVLNSPENFDLVNEFIESVMKTRIQCVFDYEECIKLKKQIELDIEEEINDLDFL